MIQTGAATPMTALTPIQHLPEANPIRGANMPQGSDDRQKQAWQAAQQFEAIFVGFLVEEATKKIPGLTGENSVTGSNVYQGMMKDIVSQKITEGGGMGLAPILYQNMMQLESSDPIPTTVPPEEKT